jgi:hypothetical protein
LNIRAPAKARSVREKQSGGSGKSKQEKQHQYFRMQALHGAENTRLVRGWAAQTPARRLRFVLVFDCLLKGVAQTISREDAKVNTCVCGNRKAFVCGYSRGQA